MYQALKLPLDQCHRFINADGTLKHTIDEQEFPLLLECYKAMMQIRIFDKKCVSLQRTGRFGTYPSVLGMEAIGIGVGKAMEEEDVFVPYYRDQATQMLRGVSLYEILMYWGGDERGADYQNCRQDLPNCVPIATQCTHAAGVASSFKIRKEKRVAVCSLGDGASSKGDFMESLNLAGTWKLPMVFVINNNQWAISVPRHLQSGAERLADKAIGAGMPGEQVDGNDVYAVYRAVKRAVDRARAGKGPALIEAISYRLCDHTTADDASRYRANEELEKAWEFEPVKRLRALLENKGLWNESQELAWAEHCQANTDKAVELFLNTEAQPPHAMFDHLYAELPTQLEEQYATLLARHHA
ncbi:pyruvate dehydrogenase (acetyl-transferring) E1 component subunit alpha [Marinibactrum halimedae]|uniref:Pyruvate dehydrogenase E1 component subunit alpha n=1 Tax=Marinibactrum halimedae TaxID=1444977 RepID=A0AA37TAE5_9GAMM|nr:pyruvate dehydrogenase (acetyl-transferring) E1 component subunit alpha [Marinibactrum halimedae]MCD9460364.1 pyruvate dehydrogenase (acetyl-transferring) E1 component subunit alpha [Marinibactrum halimedae]GLS26801.1 pyruvate dehydrogenase E1 component subunit alpha [Marinibactrum halimedae]